MRANRTYRLCLDVTVEDSDAGNPKNEENVIYAVLSRGKELFAENEADWWVEELTDQFEVVEP